MKKVFSLLLLCTVIIFVSCSKDDDSKPEPVPVTKVTLDKSTATIQVGQTDTLTVSIAPENADEKSIAWSSDKTDVATVSEGGVITAKAAGTAIITATSTADNAKKATCMVTVVNAPVPVTGVTLDKDEATLEIDETLQLTATVTPEGADNNSVTWSSSKTGIATVDATGLVTAKAAGEAVITVTTADGGKTATCTITVNEPAKTYAIGDMWPDADNAVGVVFWVNSEDASQGKIMSLDHCKLADDSWAKAQVWQSEKSLPDGKTWKCPTIDELQYMYCAFNGSEPVLWRENTDVKPVDNKNAWKEFNKKLLDPYETGWGCVYFSSTEVDRNKDLVYTLSFPYVQNVDMADKTTTYCRVRVVAEF